MDKKTIRAYNLMAKEYDEETADFWQRFSSPFIDEFKKSAREKVLNIGSGPGRDGLILQEAGLHVTCLDASETMIKLSAAKGLESVLADLTRMPFPDKTFDGAWAYTSLLHIPKSDAKDALIEIARVLKKGGILGLGLKEGDTEEYRETPGVTMPRYFAYYRRDEVASLLQNTGFELLYFEQYKPRKRAYLHFLARKI